MTFFTLGLTILLSFEAIANHQYHLGSKDEKDVVICSKEKSYYAWPWQKYHYFTCKKTTEVLLTRLLQFVTTIFHLILAFTFLI